jgi:FKBP-type peptidyl-prolyl cis-trans isomerase FkpA
MFKLNKILLLSTLCLSTSLFAAETNVTKESYAVGYELGKNISKSLNTLKNNGVEYDVAIILDGIRAKIMDNSILTEKELNSYLKSVNAKMKLAHEKSQTSKISKNEKILKDLAANTKVITTKSGLQYEIINKGKGEKPLRSNTVKVHYKGSFLNGKEFDSSYKRNKPAEFPVTGVIKGWTEVLQLMPLGSKYKITIPPNIAYGESGNRTIPPNTILQFEIELIGIK